jgi:glycosyltransferase involved in cell wall biosynthesis
MDKVSCIIPAYNEEKRIEAVLKIVANHPLIDEVIVIDDGSKDKTAEVIKKYKRHLTFLQNNPNRGKSYSVMRGISKARNKLLLFLDADLLGITSQDITNLILPIKNGEADVSISLRKNAPAHFRWIGIDFISGERVMKKSLFKDYKKLKDYPGFAIESDYINKKIIEKKLKIKVVRWEDVESPYPGDKFGFIKGNIRLTKMFFTIVNRIGFFGCIKQIFQMRALII